MLDHCPTCEVYHYNGTNHVCISWEEDKPCAVCGAPTVYVTIAAPGTGSGRTCRNNHYDGTVRELSRAEVI